MECNKDDALRAKELAEKKLLEKDLRIAKLLAMKAKEMSPNLDGLPQLLATIEVYISAEIKVNGQVDWYSVLGVQPADDYETIRKHYRKLALYLHPDKNKSAGADGAFSLITQAWSLLSDKAKRVSYDRNRDLLGKYQSVPSGKPCVPPHQNGFFNVYNAANWTHKDYRSAPHPNPTSGTPGTLKHTFWTMCMSCKTKFEYHTHYINCNLVCSNCRNPFQAFEASPPPAYRNSSSTSRISQMRQHNFNSTRVKTNSFVSGRTPVPAVNSSHGSGPFSIPSGISNVMRSASTAAEAPSVFRMSSQTLKREREDSMPGMREETHFGQSHAIERTGADSKFQSFSSGSNSVMKGDMSRKKRRTKEHKVNNDKGDMGTKIASQSGGINIANEMVSPKDRFDNAAGNYKRHGIRELSQLQIRKMLMEKARKEIREKLNVWSASSVSRSFYKSRKTDTEVKVKDKQKATNGVKLPCAKEFVDSEITNKECFSADAEVTDSLFMSVPDPDFHDFDGDRIEKAFGENQLWAVYDDDDGMPRYYAFIHTVISKKPFKMRISWLNSKTNDELAPIKWVSSGFPKTSGDFRIGKREDYSTLNSFSHRVQWAKGLRGVVQIYPKKGEVWALYRNWSADWNEFTEDEVIHKYDMVEVIEGYSEEQGVNIAPLVKIAGFKTVFRRNADLGKIKNIAKAEMFRFSHQVPSYLLTGQEGHNAPRGCLELDPASTPMELLQVFTQDQEQEVVLTIGKSVKDELWQKDNSREDGFIERCKTSKENVSVEVVQRMEVAEAVGRKESKPEISLVYKRKRQKCRRESYEVASNP